MERRKVQLTGTSTLSISLPKNWTRKNVVSQGDELLISEESDGSLSIRSKAAPSEQIVKIIEIGPQTTRDMAKRLLIGAYISGCDVFKFISKGSITPEIRYVITKEAARLIGTEIVEETHSEMTLQDFFSHEGFSAEKTMKRALMIVLGMQYDFVKAAIKHDKALARSVLMRDDEVDRLNHIVRRQMNLALHHSSLMNVFGLNSYDCLNYSITAERIAFIGDIACNSAQFILSAPRYKLSQQEERELEAANSEVKSIVEASVKVFFAKDEKLADAIITRAEKLNERFHEICWSKGRSMPFFFLFERLSEIAKFASRICQLAINRACLMEQV